MLNICKPLTSWFGADEHIQEMGFQYMIPISGLTIFYEMYQICCGLLQSEGLSWIYGICQVCSLLLNMVCLDCCFHNSKYLYFAYSNSFVFNYYVFNR